jgi:hypothetical protein
MDLNHRPHPYQGHLDRARGDALRRNMPLSWENTVVSFIWYRRLSPSATDSVPKLCPSDPDQARHASIPAKLAGHMASHTQDG